MLNIQAEINRHEQEISGIKIKNKTLRWIRKELIILADKSEKFNSGISQSGSKYQVDNRWNAVINRAKDIGFYGLPEDWTHLKSEEIF